MKKLDFMRKVLRRKFSKSENIYEILGVGENATKEEIKKAYMQKVREMHPDVKGKNEKNEEEFKKILKAYAILRNPMKKEIYDLNKNLEKREENQQNEFTMNDNNKFYQNRWYGYKRPKDDVRFEYSLHEERKYFLEKFFSSAFNKFVFILFFFFIWESYQIYKEYLIKEYLDFKKKLDSLENTSDLQKYIMKRQIKNDLETG